MRAGSGSTRRLESVGRLLPCSARGCRAYRPESAESLKAEESTPRNARRSASFSNSRLHYNSDQNDHSSTTVVESTIGLALAATAN